MNAKFKMPKFGRNLTSGSIVKELLLTTLATTISIVLTFGTASLVEQRQANRARRLLAMTIINDIDKSINVAKLRLDAEERGHDVSSYLMDHIDSLEAISDDSLFIFLGYVTNTSFTQEMEFEMTDENIFNSSQDSWRTLNDRQFLNNVREFYNGRALLDRMSKEWVYFQKPVTEEETYAMVMASDDLKDREHFLVVCRRLLQSMRVKKYIANSRYRYMLYRDFLKIIELNEENKFLMNITEQDMEDFVNQTYMTVRPAKEKQLVGTWKAVTADEKKEIVYEFRNDHTFTFKESFPWGHSIYTGFLVQKMTMKGTWQVEGDSLVKHFDLKSKKITLGELNVSFRHENAEMMAEFKKQLLSDEMRPPIVKKLEKDNRVAQATNLDQSGTRMELTQGDTKVHFQRSNNGNKH